MKGKRLSLITRAIITYITAIGAWILLSDYLINKYITNPVHLSAIRYYADWVLFFISSVFLSIILKHELETREVTEQKYQNIFEHAIEGIFQSTVDGHFISVNPTMARLHGYDSAKEMLESVKDIAGQLYVNPQERQRFVDKLLMDGTVEKFESQVYRKDGTIFWTSVNAHVVKDKNGDPLYLDGFATDITSQKTFQTALGEAESRYRSLVEEVPAAFYTQDLEDNLNSGIYISPQVEMISGYSATEWMETFGFWPGIIHAEDRELYIKENDRTNKTLEAFDLEYRIVARDGRIVWLRDISRVAYDEGGKPLHWQGILLDITERKLAEQKIEASEERYRTVIEQAADGIFISDAEGNYIDVNSSGCAMLGYTREEILQMNMRDLIPYEEVHTKPLRLREIRNGKTLMQERKLLRKDGSALPVEVSSKSLQDGRLLGIVRDVTERKLIEQTLQESEDQYRNLVEHSPYAVAVHSKGTLEYLNRAGVRLMRANNAEELYGTPIIDFVHPASRPGVLTRLQELNTGVETSPLEEKFIRRDGTTVDVEVSAYPLKYQNKPAIQVVIRDLTEQKKAEETIRSSEERFNKAFHSSPIPTCITTLDDGRFVDVNGAYLRLSKLEHKDIIGYSIEELNIHKPKDRGEFISKLVNHQIIQGEEDTFIDSMGKLSQVAAFYELIEIGGQACILSMFHDMTEEKRAQEAIRSSEEKLRAIIDNTQNIYYSHNADHILTYISGQTKNILGYDANEALINWKDFLTDHPINQRGLALAQTAIDTGLPQEPYVLELKAKDGQHVWVEVRETPIIRDGRTSSVVGALINITERKEAEEQMERRLAELTVLQAVAIAGSQGDSEDEIIEKTTQIINGMLYPDNCGILSLNQDGTILKPHTSYRGVLPESAAQGYLLSKGITGRVASTGSPARIADVTSEPDYIESTASIRSELCVPIRVNEKIIGVLNAESRKLNAFDEEDERLMNTVAGTLGTALERIRLFRAEQKQRQNAEHLREATAALTSTLKLPDLYNVILTALEKIVHNDSSSIILDRNGKMEIVAGLGFPKDTPLIGRTLPDNAKWQEIQKAQHPIILADAQQDMMFKSWTETSYIHGWMGIPLIVEDSVLGFINVDSRQINTYTAEDAALGQTFANQAAMAIKNAFLYKSEQRRHQEAEKLRQAATAVASSLNLKEVLGLLLNALKDVVPFDTASIILPEDDQVRIVAANGFPDELQIVDKTYPANDGLFDHIIANGQSLILEDAQLDSRFKKWPGSDLIHGWMAVPMIARGQVIGFITLDSSMPGTFSPGDAELAQSFAHQASVAIENTRLFESLQQTNLDLSQAYDTTLEGWGKALELRDKETQGHTLRVTNLTLKLARQIGFNSEQLINLRRGVLVHDIGKMGVPDHILHKKGPLTKDEWGEMQKHPQHAFDLLYPIAYLRPSLDVAYCHHEWWDGSGYPRGLHDIQIPLAARIFAVVDVWDALLYERPYRKAWSKKKVMRYIQDQTGIHFDPEVVKVFLQMMENEQKK